MFVRCVHSFVTIVLPVDTCPLKPIRSLRSSVNVGKQKSIAYVQAHFSSAHFPRMMENFPKLAQVSLLLGGLCSLTSKQGDPTRLNEQNYCHSKKHTEKTF